MSALAAPQPYLVRTEAELIGAVRSGDDEAFAELYSRYGDRILGYVRGIVGDHGRAEDIAQEVFISALRGMRSDQRAIAFKPWLFEIARNACIDEFRRLKRSPEVVINGEDRQPALAAVSPPPEICLEQRQQLDDLRGAFSGLTDSQHKALVLRELGGRTYTEIASQLDMSVPMVESTLFRARRRLGQEYDEIASGRRCERVQELIDADAEQPMRLLGLRERRRFARHVAHCQPCRRHARAAGIDDDLLNVPSIAKKLAALLPFPILRWWRTKSPRVLRSFHRAVHTADPGLAAGAGQAAVAVVTTAIVAGSAIGGGLAPAAKQMTHASNVVAAHVQTTAAKAGNLPPALARHHSASSRGIAAVRHRPAKTLGTPHLRMKPGSRPPSPPSSTPSRLAPNLPPVPVPPAPSVPSIPNAIRHLLPSVPTPPVVHSVQHHVGSLVKKLTRALKQLL